MGLLDLFTAEGKLKRNIRRVADRDAQPEDREAAARFLADEASQRAIMGLLSRFDLNLTQQMKDRTEKELALELLRDLGREAVGESVRKWLRRAKQYAWPLRLLVELEGREAAVDVVVELLKGTAGSAAFEPGRRKELLVWLAEHPHPAAVDVVIPFLGDFDEEVRYAAGEVLASVDDERVREPLLRTLADPSEESTRLKHRIARLFAARGWPVDDATLGGRLPQGFAVQAGRVVAR